MIYTQYLTVDHSNSITSWFSVTTHSTFHLPNRHRKDTTIQPPVSYVKSNLRILKNYTKKLKRRKKRLKLTENIFGADEEAFIGIWYSQSGTYKPYNKKRYRVVSIKAKNLREGKETRSKCQTEKIKYCDSGYEINTNKV